MTKDELLSEETDTDAREGQVNQRQLRRGQVFAPGGDRGGRAAPVLPKTHGAEGQSFAAWFPS